MKHGDTTTRQNTHARMAPVICLVRQLIAAQLRLLRTEREAKLAVSLGLQRHQRARGRRQQTLAAAATISIAALFHEIVIVSAAFVVTVVVIAPICAVVVVQLETRITGVIRHVGTIRGHRVSVGVCVCRDGRVSANSDAG